MTRATYNATLQTVAGADSAIVVPAANARAYSLIDTETQVIVDMIICSSGHFYFCELKFKNFI